MKLFFGTLLTVLLAASSAFAQSKNLIDCTVVKSLDSNHLGEGLSPGDSDYNDVYVERKGTQAKLGGFYVRPEDGDSIQILNTDETEDRVLLMRKTWEQDQYLVIVNRTKGPREGSFWGEVQYRSAKAKKFKKIVILVCKK